MANDPIEVDGIFRGTEAGDVIIDTTPGLTYWGLGGNDVFIASPNNADWNGFYYSYLGNNFDGGSGSDTIDYSLGDKPILASLQTGIVHYMLDGYVQSSDHLNSIENMIGSGFGDTIYGSSGANHLWGFGGNDTIRGSGGNDQIAGDSGNDALYGDAGNDLVDGGTGNDYLEGSDGADTLNGGDGRDRLWGGAGNDVLKGGAHIDLLIGGSGDDRLEGGSGNDILNGGTGTDTAVYTGSGAVSVNLWLGTATGAWGADHLANIERIETGGGNDIVFGSFGGNRLTTGAGSDIIYALDGHDTVYSGSGADTVDGYEGNDLIYGGSGNDRIWGGDDGDTIYGESGQDLINGDAGNDALFGGDGSDKLRGGDGLDTINGGAGPDIFAWTYGDSGRDTIAGFNLGQDKLWFERGYFATDAIGPIALDHFLTVLDSGPDAYLRANTAEYGWITIAKLLNVDADALGEVIADGSILAPAAAELGDLLG